MTKPADTAPVAKIDAVQAEYSAFETLHETDGLISTARELNIAYVAYSPLGHGWLVDDFPYESPEDFAADDFRRTGKLLSLPLLSSLSQRWLSRREKLTQTNSAKIPRPELLRQQEDRFADQNSRGAQGLHSDAGRVSVGDRARHDSDSGHDEAAASGREFRFEGSGAHGRGEEGDAWYSGLAEAAGE